VPTSSLAIHAKQRRDRSAFVLLLVVCSLLLVLAVPLASQLPDKRSAAGGASAPVRTFEQLDRNADGSLERSEAVKLPGLAIIFERADADGDERLSKVEYAKALAMLEQGR
jgi:hypothetical protein